MERSRTITRSRLDILPRVVSPRRDIQQIHSGSMQLSRKDRSLFQAPTISLDPPHPSDTLIPMIKNPSKAYQYLQTPSPSLSSPLSSPTTPLTHSSALTRNKSGPPQTALTARVTSSANFIRPAKSPPYASVRLFVSGERNWWIR